MTGDCTQQAVTGGKKGACGKQSYNWATFKGQNQVTVDFGTGCGADWLGDPQAQDVIPGFGTILSYVPTYNVNASDGDPTLWSYYMSCGQQNSYSTAGKGDDAGAAVVYQESWANKCNNTW